MKLNIIECGKCGLLFSDSNDSIKKLYMVKDGMEQYGSYLDCPVCEHKTVIQRDYGFDYIALVHELGENYTDNTD